MRYFGGKAKIAKPLAEFLNSQLLENQPFVDLFCGSCNVISKIDSKRKRIANDFHEELIELHKVVQNGYPELPDKITEDQYNFIKNSKVTPKYLKGFVGFGLSFSGKWWGGYARDGSNRNYCMNAKNSILKKHKTLGTVEFYSGSYEYCQIPHKALVYCDIPYKNTTKYSTGDFNHEEFYKWAENKRDCGIIVLVSEYKHNVPTGWDIVWEHSSKKDIRNSEGVQEATIEVVMTPRKLNET